MKKRPARLALALLAVATGLAAPAAAHDTWFEQRSATARGQAVLALGTGNQFPHHEFQLVLSQLQRHGCRAEGATEALLEWVADEPTALVLQTPARGHATRSCWAQLVPFEVEIDDVTVEVYLDEIRALPAVRERWAALRARGVRWKETYVKHARIELAGDAHAAATARASAPAVDAMGLDVRLEPGAWPLRAGDTLRAQVLRDGQPLGGLPVELRSDLSPIGLWRHTDGQGRVELKLPLAARWVLRGVDLRPSEREPDAWDSRFVTLAFEVQR